MLEFSNRLKNFSVNFSETGRLLSEGKKLGIACSGGADSMFLLCSVLAKFCNRKDQFLVLHFNHRVRSDSDLDELHVKNFCLEEGVKFVSGRPDKAIRKKSEEEFRKMRGKFFKKCFREEKLSAILQGHHAGDARETFLMRAMRGSGLEGLRAPREDGELDGVRFLRPLLGVEKSDMKEALLKSGISWREDSSNSEAEFFRNRVRNILIPEMEKISPLPLKKCMARTRKLLIEDSDFILKVLSCETKQDGRGIVASRKVLENAALLRRAVAGVLSGKVSNFGFSDWFVEKILGNPNSMLKASAGAGFAVYEPLRGKKSGRISFEQAASKTPSDNSNIVRLAEGRNKLPDGSEITVRKKALSGRLRGKIFRGEVDDSSRVYLSESAGEKGFFARFARVGDSYVPLRGKSERGVSKMLAAKKISSLKRNKIPRVLIGEGKIAWVPNLPPADFAAVEEGDSFAFELTFTPTIS